MKKFVKKLLCISILNLVVITYVSAYTSAIERPLIWITPQEKPQVLKKIADHEWAKNRFIQLQKRADDFAPTDLAKRIENVKTLPLDWANKTDKFPAFIEQANIGNNHLREPLQLGLQAAIDCGILYYLTDKEQYAHCAADILHNVVQALSSAPIKVGQVDLNNRGWIVPENHLLESRIYSAQIPLIYDFVFNYLKAGGKVYDVHKNTLTSFDFTAAQQVFESYAQLALDSGLINNNWPVLESSSLVHNALAIDDNEKRHYYLQHYLLLDTNHQDSLKKVAESYANPGDIWPESLNYSMHVAYFSLYLMTLIDRIEPSLQLGKRYPNITSAFLTNEQLRFPNGDYPAFGDGDRSYTENYLELELAYKSAILNKNQTLIDTFANELKHAVENGKYDRSSLMPRHTSAKPYYAPIELLWPVADLGNKASQVTFNAYTTVDIPFAGMFIQRNLSTQNTVKNSLMVTIGGGSYVHGHASGIDMELYGQGHVLGIEAGKGQYPSNVHQNYNRLFAGHNTVISNGASASKGDWINLGINRVEKVAMEPEPRTEPVSDKYSFVTASFYDEHNLAKAAYHQRTTAIIRLNDKVGYYLDVFRAKSDTPEQYHDYLYRNLADSMSITAACAELKLVNDPERFKPFSAEVAKKWRHDKNFAHPGWHFFTEVKTSEVCDNNMNVTFTADGFKNSPVIMNASIVEGLDLTITQAKVPPAKIEHPPYNKKELPIMVLRHQGDTWLNPFVVTYESYQGAASPVIKSTSRLMQGDEFKGVKVITHLNGNTIEQFILVQQSMTEQFILAKENISFTGTYAVITLTNGKLTEMYIGNGTILSYQENVVTAKSPSTSAYRRF